jgi:hypothetical protein
VLLVILAAFTGQWATFAVARATQVTICAADPGNTKPILAIERRTSPIPPPPNPPEQFERQPQLRDLFVPSERFQRPPPVLLSLS